MFVSEVPADHVDCRSVRGPAADQPQPAGGVDDGVAGRAHPLGRGGLVEPQGEREARVTVNMNCPASLQSVLLTAGLALQNVRLLT